MTIIEQQSLINEIQVLFDEQNAGKKYIILNYQAALV